MTIRVKITLWFSALMIVIFAIMFSMIFIINRYVLYSDVKGTLRTVVEENRDEIEYTEDFDSDDVEPGDHYILYGDGYLEIDDDFIPERKGVYSVLLDGDGRTIYGKSPVAIPFSDREGIWTQMAGQEKYYVCQVRLAAEEMEGLVLQGIVNEDASETILGRMAELTLLVAPLLVLAAIVGGFLLAGTFLRPIRKMTETAESINDGADLSRRIELERGRDDLHQLAYSFNHMMDRLERLEVLPEEEEVDLSQLVELVSEEQLLNSRKGITLECRAEPGLAIRGNTELLVRLLTNLISNAYRYGRAGGHIMVSAFGRDEEICISVRDDGIGMEQHEMDRIFHRFYQADAARCSQEHSLGLGLSMAAEIARLHHARISVESEKGKGSEFLVIFMKR